ncbi:hypothetical protein Agub_g6736, partial [Astrephomene gubernaculifera]
MRACMAVKPAILYLTTIITTLALIISKVFYLTSVRTPGSADRLLADQPQLKTLVVILAETRAHELTWRSFHDNVLSVLNADLAVCISNETDKDDPFTHAAKYKWLHAEPKDWADAFDNAANC